MTYFIEKPTYHTTEFKIRFDKQTEKEIPCKVMTTYNGKVMIEYQSGSETFIKWINQEQIIEK